MAVVISLKPIASLVPLWLQRGAIAIAADKWILGRRLHGLTASTTVVFVAPVLQAHGGAIGDGN